MTAKSTNLLPAPLPTTKPPPWGVGVELGGYRLRRYLGSGGLGVVYEAEGAHGGLVALKCFGRRADLPRDDTDSFTREEALRFRLHHPNIVEVLDAGVHEGVVYLVMELVAGESLAHHTRTPDLLPMTETLRICADVARALSHAHAREVIHRDVKPDNILLDRTKRAAKLTDFGIATLGDAFRTQTGVIPGTPAYMSPEQLCGGVVDARTDLYALGVVLFETLSGSRPHSAASLGMLLREVASRDAPPLNSVRPEVPEPVAVLVSRLLERSPACRPASAATVADELYALADRAHPAGLGPKSRG